MEIKMSEKMTYKVLKQEGRAKRAVMETCAWYDPDTGFYECRNCCSD